MHIALSMSVQNTWYRCCMQIPALPIHMGLPGGLLLFYCLTCKVSVCQLCTVVEHPVAVHNVKTATTAAAELSLLLSTDLVQCKAGIETLHAFGGTVAAAVLRATQQCESTKVAIRARAQRLVADITAAASALCNEVDLIHVQKSVVLKKQEARVRNGCHQLRLAEAVAIQAIAGGQPTLLSSAIGTTTASKKLPSSMSLTLDADSSSIAFYALDKPEWVGTAEHAAFRMGYVVSKATPEKVSVHRVYECFL
jgi:hypothetical protein